MGEVIKITNYCDPQMLSNLGHFSYFFAHKIREQVVMTKAELAQTVHFRAKVYKDLRQLASWPNESDFSTPYDKRSKIINFRWNHQIVASVSLNIPGSDGFIECLEGNNSRRAFELLMNKKDIVEVSKLTIDPRFIDTDLSDKIMESIYREQVLSDRSILLAYGSYDCLKFYSKLGLKDAKLSFWRRDKRFDKMFVVASEQKVVGHYGVGLGPVRWNRYCRSTYLRLKGKYSIGPLGKMILSSYNFIGPAINMTHKLIIYFRWLIFQGTKKAMNLFKV